MKKTDGRTKSTARFPGFVYTQIVCNWVVRTPLRTNTKLSELKNAQEILQNKKAENALKKNLARNAHIVSNCIIHNMIQEKPPAEILHIEPLALLPNRVTCLLISISLSTNIMFTMS